MGDETGVKSSFKDKFFLVCAGRRTLSISEDPDNLMSGAGSTWQVVPARSHGGNLLTSLGFGAGRLSFGSV